MTWKEGAGLLRLLAEERIGAPSRQAKLANEEQEIERLKAGLRGPEI